MTTSGDMATKGERELLGALRGLLNAVGNATTGAIVSAVVQHVEAHLAQMLRTAAVAGLSGDETERVLGRMDHALRSTSRVDVQGPSFTIARQEDGRVSVNASIDLNAVAVAYVGDYGTSRKARQTEPLVHAFKVISAFPSLEILVPPPQVVINNVAPQKTVQRVSHNEQGEIAEIVTTSN